MARALLVLVLAVLSGCQIVPERSENSPYYPVPVGSKLVLNQPLDFPADDVSLFIQGKPLSYFSANKYYAYCKFELWTRLDKARTIQPDTFTITRVSRESRYTQRETNPAVMKAAWRTASRDDSGGIGYEITSWVMYLHSDKQPDVYRITCEHWQDPNEATPLSIAEMRKAFGDVFTLELAQ
jgi:hypothetical protein